MIVAVRILGIPCHDVSYDEAVGLVRTYIQSRQPHQIVTLNPEFVVAARRDAGFRRVLETAALSLPDGIGLLLAARLNGTPIRQHVRGTDFVLRLAEVGSREGWRFFLLGAAEGVADEAAAALQRQFPDLQIAGTYAGFSAPAHDDETSGAVLAAAPVDILLVAYGAPAQDQWIARNQARIGVPVAIGVGGVLDYFSGRVPRAPAWLRRLELEWLYRLIRQPWRWRRQLALPRFAAAVLWARLLDRRA